MSVRAKFQVSSKSEPRTVNQWLNSTKTSGAAEVVDIQLMPVTHGSEENDKFYASTPGGFLTLSTVNKAAADELAQGKEYYIDITEA
jgi:hypothetical protein